MDMKKIIYVDNAATTCVDTAVLEEMMQYLTRDYGNPSSIYSLGREASLAVLKARSQVATALGCSENEIYFTSCGTEADNWAITNAAKIGKSKGKTHIISTNFEHHAVLHTLQQLEKQGFSVTYLPINSDGYITVEQVKDAITDETCLVSVMYANNEIGTIQPIKEIGALCRKNFILFHTDAVQAVGNLPINVVTDNIDFLALSGHKIHAPKGVGALYVRKGIKLTPFIEGGGQERGRRGGTENVASIVGLGAAIAHHTSNIEEKIAEVTKMRDYLIDNILGSIEHSKLNGGMVRLCGNVNISFEAIEGEGMLLLLDMNGICASSGSACTSGSLDPSHVLMALGLPHEMAHGSLRLTIDQNNTYEDLDKIIEVLPGIIAKLRAMSPIWNR